MRAILCITVLACLLYSTHASGKFCRKNDTFKEPADGSCEGYWECDSGKVAYKTCPILHSFDSNQLKCVLTPLSSVGVSCGTDKGSSADKWCTVGQIYKAPVKGLCDSYYDCFNGNLKLKKCSWPLTFSEREGICTANFGSQNNCSENKEHMSTTAISTTSTSSNNTPSNGNACVKGKTYVSVYPKDCSKYYKCQDGRVSVLSCGYFKRFDPATLQCRYLWTKNCFPDDVTTVPPTTVAVPSTTRVAPSTTVAVPSTTAAPLKTTSAPSEQNMLVCLKDNYYTAPSTEDCQKYFVCSHGNTSAESCSYFYRFDPTTHTCKINMPFYNVNCSAIPEKPICKKGYNFKTRFLGDKNKYYDCSNGTLKEKVCGYWQEFSMSNQACQYSILGFNYRSNDSMNKSSPNELCPKDAHFNASYPGNCQMYSNCNNGSYSTFECPNGYKFDGQAGRCTVMTQCDLLTCNAQGPLCYPGVNYSVPDHKDCKRYSECANGNWNVKWCGMLHKFNPSTLKCEFTLGVDCEARTKCDNTPIPASLYRTKLEIDETYFKSTVDLALKSAEPTCGSGQSFKTVYPGDCSKYYDCSKGVLTVKPCSVYQKFDPTSLECRFDLPFDPVNCNNIVAQPSCEADQDFRTIFPGDCSKFFDCNKGVLAVRQCYVYQKFDPKTLKCRFDSPFNPVNCTSLIGEPSCKQGMDFKKVYPGHCDQYYNCKNGTLTVEKCYFWQKFDPTTLECKMNYIYNSVNCSAIPGSGIKHNGTKTSDSNSFVVATTTASPQIVGPSCSKGNDFKSIYPNDCQMYFDCKNGTETIEKCSWFKKFDPATLKCRWDIPFYRVNCSAIPGSGLPEYPKSIQSKCQPGKTFDYVNEKDCSSYYSCKNGILSLESCGLMKKFDPLTLTCSYDVPFHRVNCTALPGEPICPSKGIHRRAFPQSCSKYYECNNGTVTVVPCGLLQKFDIKKQECSFDIPFHSVDCGN